MYKGSRKNLQKHIQDPKILLELIGHVSQLYSPDPDCSPVESGMSDLNQD